ncbi:ubiquitin-like protein [Bimuria novae-zelandiae CBS 107.79]|uniref:Ubiquitin-like modifier HUB1 n=1 Tax=Bimuria novae-zelandiae CBS 107.79 TaxID=1447943 RepID=A0A6A5UWS7_9PLEO|nr:ubiquitin-like protein [Bimuria novae-zelandiae CBS 107.79]
MPSPDAIHPDRVALVEGTRPRSPPPKEGARSRSRSRSPRRSLPRRPKNYSGLKWKKNDRGHGDREQARDRDDRRGGYDRDRRDDRDRGYRSREDGDRGHGRDRRDDDRRRDWDRPRDDRDRRDRDSDRGGRDRDSDRRRDKDRDSDRRQGDRDRDRESKPKLAAAPPTAVPGEPMIMVSVNDRLGTKAQIPCLASDPVKLFKAMVAAKIGRPVHEIMLKRQGERPFLDQLSLADYGVSNGVQIDLELNTGD